MCAQADRLPCSGKNVDCSHFCFIVGVDSTSLQRHCGCPHGMTVNVTDQRTCVAVPEPPPYHDDCPAGSFQCDDGRCIAPQYRCDKENDCADASDERNCTGLLSSHARPDRDEYAEYAGIPRGRRLTSRGSHVD